MPKISKKAASKKVLSSKENEKVLVVSRQDLFGGKVFNGITSENLQRFVKVINTKRKFLTRGVVEEDPNYKQIIPFIVFESHNKIFLMQRKSTHTDKRLANKYSLGIGGHVNLRDMNGKGDIMSWAKREFEEEVNYTGNYTSSFLGILNDDSNPVGLVHAGLVILMKGDSEEISVRDEHLSGKLVAISEVKKVYKNMETWGQIIYDHLVKSKNQSIKVSKPQEKTKISGILPDWVIEKYIEEGKITISPLSPDWRKNIDQVSVDFRLGTNIKLFRAGAYRFIDTRRGLPSDAMEELVLKEGDPFILEPGAFAIASTKELLKLPSDVLGRLEGKSSLARLGILVHSTAARFDPGWNGAPVLELGNLGPKPAILYCGMPICAFTFEQLAAPVKMKYEGSRSDRYSGSRLAVVSKIDSAISLNVKKKPPKNAKKR